jgi:zinc transport system ATP-binding protein
MLVEAHQAVFGYGGQRVVRAERLVVRAGECVGVFGPNGSGKSTLVRGLVGLLAPLSGEVRRQSALRIGYVPQRRSLEQHWPMTALDAASLAISAGNWFGRLGHARGHVLKSMQELGVLALKDKRFASLSGGQQQRVILAGALATDPQLLVLDEPTDGLDLHSRREFLELIRRRAQAGPSLLYITHEVDDLVQVGTSVAWLHPGEEYGEPSRVELLLPTGLAERLSGGAAPRGANGLPARSTV